MLTTDQKGSVAELAIAHAAAKLGVGVFKPLTDGERYDLIFDFRPRLLRVQCKSALLEGAVLKVPCYSARRNRNGFVKRFYRASEIDAIVAHNIELDRCFLIPFDEIRSRAYVQLRLESCRNNQHLGVNWADEFAFDARLKAFMGP